MPPKAPARQTAPKAVSVYREAELADDSLAEADLLRIEEAISRAALEGWSVRRVGAQTWKLIDERDPSAFWSYEYTIIAFASPRGVLVLHGRVVGPHKPWEGARSFGEGTFMPDLAGASIPPTFHQFRDIDSFLSRRCSSRVLRTFFTRAAGSTRAAGKAIAPRPCHNPSRRSWSEP